MAGKSTRDSFQRLCRAVTKRPDGCIVFTGYLDKQRYGRLFHRGEKRLVHRVAYELLVGPIPEGYGVDHLCFTRNCVNPRHLEAVTPRENTLRSSAPSALHAVKTHCDNGHEFTPANTRERTDYFARICRACDAERARRYRASRRAA